MLKWPIIEFFKPFDDSQAQVFEIPIPDVSPQAYKPTRKGYLEIGEIIDPGPFHPLESQPI